MPSPPLIILKRLLTLAPLSWLCVWWPAGMPKFALLLAFGRWAVTSAFQVGGCWDQQMLALTGSFPFGRSDRVLQRTECCCTIKLSYHRLNPFDKSASSRGRSRDHSLQRHPTLNSAPDARSPVMPVGRDAVKHGWPTSRRRLPLDELPHGCMLRRALRLGSPVRQSCSGRRRIQSCLALCPMGW